MDDVSAALTPPSTPRPAGGLLEENHVYKPFRYPWAYEAWLTQQRVHWLPEEVPLADDVKDWQKNITDGERNLLTQIFRFFTQADVEVNNCFREGTEILTSHGWVDFRNITMNTLVAQVDPAMRVTFVTPEEIVVQDAPSQILRLHSDRGFDIQVTNNHDMVVLKSDGHAYKIRADQYPNTQNIWQPLAAATRREGFGLSPRDRLMIAYQADATKNEFRAERKSSCVITFNFKKQRKIDRLLQIIKLCGYEYNVVPSGDDCTRITAVLPDVHEPIPHDFSWIDLSRVNVTWCREFIEEMSHWDAWVSPEQTSIQYRSTVESSVDMAQAIATLAGYKTKKVFLNYDYQSAHWLLSISRETAVIATDSISTQIVHTNPGEKVYCVSVPTGAIVVRANGMPLVCGNCYMRMYAQVFKPTEVLMMLSAFSNIETVHISAYSHLLDTIGMPEIEYQAFLKYKAMKDKFDFMQGFSVDSKYEIARTLAGFGAFTEGLQLFASFAILLNFPRFGKLRGMGQIITWSVRDESLHFAAVIKLFRTFIQENPEIWTPKLRNDIRTTAIEIIKHEDAFIDLAFEMGPIEGLTAHQVKCYIRYIANRRMIELGLEELFEIEKNPLPWLDEMLNAVEHTNFFENRATEYSKASTGGTWEDAFGDTKPTVEAPISVTAEVVAAPVLSMTEPAANHGNYEECESCQ